MRFDYEGTTEEKLKKDSLVKEFDALTTEAEIVAFVDKYSGKKEFDLLVAKLLFALNKA